MDSCCEALHQFPDWEEVSQSDQLLIIGPDLVLMVSWSAVVFFFIILWIMNNNADSWFVEIRWEWSNSASLRKWMYRNNTVNLLVLKRIWLFLSQRPSARSFNQLSFYCKSKPANWWKPTNLLASVLSLLDLKQTQPRSLQTVHYACSAVFLWLHVLM